MAELPPALLDAIAFAARAHDGQRRKDGRTPYVSHVFRVCLITRHLFGVDDPKVLQAAVLHDTVEDTTTDFDDIEERFGADVAHWVAALSKDKRQQDHAREAEYCLTLSAAPWQVRVCKLADIYDNLSDSGNQPQEKRARSISRSRKYLDALKVGMPGEIERPLAIVEELWSRLQNSAK
jgi:guanosine-3',5'-bis(diphosphate) 3'-pyrophosphohydrolase